MSSSRHHIPFPRNFLSLNTPVKKTNDAVVVVGSPQPEVGAHNFLSNQQTPLPRHSSISSVSSVESSASTASSPAARERDVPPAVVKPALAAFLALNTKPAAAPPPTEAVKSPFLSNRV